ncbi:MAG: adenylate/guanylate cyclase domain-containing protein [Leptospirales bacterium]|nr:adenylate/guanylate cyclase domain-containing protein [Leptospirales bacterium]
MSFRTSILQSVGQSLTSDQIEFLAREVDKHFDLGQLSGFGTSIRVPQQVAVRCVGDHFSADRDLLAFLSRVLLAEGTFLTGMRVGLKGKATLLELLELQGWKFDRQMGQFIKDQTSERTADWGHMVEGSEYHLSFAALDVVKSSEFQANEAQVFSALREYIRNYAEVWNGRLWNWMGDGGIVAFHGSDAVNRSAISMMAVLLNLPVFNIKYLPGGPELRLRIGMHYGTATYKNPVNEIFSNDLRIAQKLEAEVCEPNRIAISSSVYTFLKPELYPWFQPGPRLDQLDTYKLTRVVE